MLTRSIQFKLLWQNEQASGQTRSIHCKAWLVCRKQPTGLCLAASRWELSQDHLLLWGKSVHDNLTGDLFHEYLDIKSLDQVRQEAIRSNVGGEVFGTAPSSGRFKSLGAADLQSLRRVLCGEADSGSFCSGPHFQRH